MNDSKPVISDSELKLMEMRKDLQQYSYDLTQRLTFFVISIELVFCGYILLNADKLGAARFSGLLFLCAGVAALFGLGWRFFYNEKFHLIAHGKGDKASRLASRIQMLVYWIFISLTGLFLISTIVIGYLYLHRIEMKPVKNKPSASSTVSLEKGPIAPPQKDESYNAQPKETNDASVQGKGMK